MALKLFARKHSPPVEHPPVPTPAPQPPPAYEPAEPVALEQDPVQRAIQCERFGWLVCHRHQWGDHPLIEVGFEAAVEAIDDRFALVPEGFVSIAQCTCDGPGSPEIDVQTAPFLLAQHCVTNAQFQWFVDGGGYTDMELWPREIWPHLIDFKDVTGEPGPRFWREGRHDRRLADHPVAGICHYEAAAYACWAGYRLPTGAEWQMAASWRIRSAAHVMRRYPWGDSFDTSRCNVWLSGVGGSVPVQDYPDGAAPNGVLQLIGNVWEWTDSDYEVTDDCGRTVVGDMQMKEIRGGAFDTYFASQATSSFRSALASLARAHNVGFRCVVDLNADHRTTSGNHESELTKPEK